MRKGIAIHTILLLVVGLIAVGVVAYVVYKSFTGSALGREECRARIISHCTSCDMTKFASTGPVVSKSLADACSTYYTKFTEGETCDNLCGVCKGFIPTTHC